RERDRTSNWHFEGANTGGIESLTDKALKYQLAQLDGLPQKETRRTMDLYGIPYDIDKEIRKTVIDLGKRGFTTIGSCAGHVNLPGKKGFINLSHTPTESQKESIAKIAKKHGLNRIEFDNNTLLFSSFVKTAGETFKTKEEANRYAKKLKDAGQKIKVEKRGIYFMVYKDKEIE
ncbi:MAG: hypothetical protein KKD44_25680, partial [Proteobacteria bacterium]|nr:hypothetical protein [Pseudomonadota bacterium]